MRDVTWINGLAQHKRKKHATCSLTEASMLLAVLSASMLRPVELLRMVSRSPSSVTGLCSGAGIPPVWTNTHTELFSTGTHLKEKKKTNTKNPTQSCTYISHCVCMCKYTTVINTHLSRPLPDMHRRVMLKKWLSMVTRHHQQYTNTHPHMPYGPKGKRLSMLHVYDSANQCQMALTWVK